MRPILCIILAALIIYSCQKPDNKSNHIPNQNLSLSDAMDSMRISYNTLYRVTIHTTQGVTDTQNSIMFYADSLREYYDTFGVHLDSASYSLNGFYSIYQPEETYDYANMNTRGSIFLKYKPLGGLLLADTFSVHNYLVTDTMVFSSGTPTFNYRSYNPGGYYKPVGDDSQKVFFSLHEIPQQ